MKLSHLFFQESLSIKAGGSTLGGFFVVVSGVYMCVTLPLSSQQCLSCQLCMCWGVFVCLCGAVCICVLSVFGRAQVWHQEQGYGTVMVRFVCLFACFDLI